jgi:hypothetical protein
VPFTTDEFFGVFRDYNLAVWPAQWVLTAVGVAALACALSRRPLGPRVALALLAGLWLWMAVAYHLAHFWRVNPAAPLFALAFAAGAALLLGAALRSTTPRFELRRSPRSTVGIALAVYGLAVYPLLNPLFGHAYPAAPGFGLPCPTTIFTIGVLGLAWPRPPRALLVVPVAWSVVGTAAAVALGVYQDYVLGLAGLWGLYLAFGPADPTSDPGSDRDPFVAAASRRILERIEW